MADEEKGRLTTGWKIVIILAFLGAGSAGGRAEQRARDLEGEVSAARSVAFRAQDRAEELAERVAALKKRVAALEAKLAPEATSGTAEPK